MPVHANCKLGKLCQLSIKHGEGNALSIKLYISSKCQYSREFLHLIFLMMQTETKGKKRNIEMHQVDFVCFENIRLKFLIWFCHWPNLWMVNDYILIPGSYFVYLYFSYKMHLLWVKNTESKILQIGSKKLISTHRFLTFNSTIFLFNENEIHFQNNLQVYQLCIFILFFWMVSQFY